MPEATVATVVWAVGSPPSASTAPAIRAEAAPPKAFRRATISGIAVIWIFNASIAPMVEPRMIPARMTVMLEIPAPKI